MEKELINKLVFLKSVEPDKAWREERRAILLAQVYGAAPDTDPAARWQSHYFWFALREVFQPVATMALVILAMVTGGVLSFRAAEDTKPGDSFYVAKLVSEQTQRVLTFDEKKKANLSLTFATNRLKELSATLAEPETDDREAKVNALVSNIKKELTVAKAEMDKLAIEHPDVTPDLVPAEMPGEVFSAGADREARGLSTSDQVTEPSAAEPAPSATPAAEPQTADSTTATTTDTDAPDTTASSSPDEIAPLPAPDAAALIEQVMDKLDNNDINAAQELLSAVEGSLPAVDDGQVKGETEAATTTPVVETGSATSTD